MNQPRHIFALAYDAQYPKPAGELDIFTEFDAAFEAEIKKRIAEDRFYYSVTAVEMDKSYITSKLLAGKCNTPRNHHKQAMFEVFQDAYKYDPIRAVLLLNDGTLLAMPKGA